jgi:hypothetical protein
MIAIRRLLVAAVILLALNLVVSLSPTASAQARADAGHGKCVGVAIIGGGTDVRDLYRTWEDGTVERAGYDPHNKSLFKEPNEPAWKVLN